MVARLFVLLVLVSSPSFAADRVTDLHLRQLALVEHDAVSLARAMPADKYDFRPTEGAFQGVRTFGEQVKHLATYHGYNHYGQMVVYARMNGIVPPSSQR